MDPVVDVDQLTRRYRGGGGVEDISFTLSEGEFFGLIGPNASGKSTTIYLLLGLVRREAGSVRVMGSDPAGHPGEVFDEVGALIEQPKFYPGMTARQNLYRMNLHRRSVDPDEMESVLDRVGLDPFNNQKLSTYSQGMRQRLGIANAILGEPRLVVLDEPTANLDPDGTELMLDLFQRFNRESGITFLYCTHRVEQASKLCDRIGFLKGGFLEKIVEFNEIYEQFDPVRFQLLTGAEDGVEGVLDRIPEIESWRQSETVRNQYFLELSSSAPEHVHRKLVEEGIEVKSFSSENNPLLQLYRDLL